MYKQDACTGARVHVCVCTQVLKVLLRDKLVVVVDGALGTLLQLLRQVVQEGAPSRSGAQGLKRETHKHMRQCGAPERRVGREQRHRINVLCIRPYVARTHTHT